MEGGVISCSGTDLESNQKSNSHIEISAVLMTTNDVYFWQKAKHSIHKDQHVLQTWQREITSLSILTLEGAYLKTAASLQLPIQEACGDTGWDPLKSY